MVYRHLVDLGITAPPAVHELNSDPALDLMPQMEVLQHSSTCQLKLGRNVPEHPASDTHGGT